MPPEPTHELCIRQAKPEDAALCGQICFDAFTAINRQHAFPPDFPSAEVAQGLLGMLFAHPGYYCEVAEVDGVVVGSNCLDERSPITGLGPITVAPGAQNRGAGRKLMESALTRAGAQGRLGVRLVQVAFHTRSMALYASLGFDTREPLACMNGAAIGRVPPGCTVRAAETADIAACADLSFRVHGFSRAGELPDAIAAGGARVVLRDGRLTAYTTGVSFFGHAAAETNLDLQALLGATEAFGGPGVLIPTRNAELFRWCLAKGLRIVQPLTLMSWGLYQEPAGAFWPSILY